MKFFTLILIFAFILTSCSKVEEFRNISEQKLETENLPFEQPDKPPILEITEDSQGLWDATGKSLFFNLYDNGIIEFEYRDNEKRAGGKKHRAEEVSSLKRTKISEEELRKFTDLLRSEGFQRISNEYKRKCCCTDAVSHYQINFKDGNKQKHITLNGYCGLSELKNPQARYNPDLPQILSKLLILADNVRWKYKPQ